MCATCGCGDDGATITAMSARAKSRPARACRDIHDTPPRPSPRPRPRRARPHRDRSRWSRRCWQRTTCSPSRTGSGWPNATSWPSTSPARRARARPRCSSAPSASLDGQRPVAVIEGDQETLLDAERIRATGRRAVQVNTGAGCHLDAGMVRRALDALDPEPGSLLFIENVGNLVCPALFDLGERAKVVVISVTEGDDKPLKYPAHVRRRRPGAGQQDRPAAVRRLRSSNVCAARAVGEPRRRGAAVSATTGDGIDAWYEWIDARASLVGMSRTIR